MLLFMADCIQLQTFSEKDWNWDEALIIYHRIFANYWVNDRLHILEQFSRLEP